MDSGQSEAADFISDVCQLVSVEHFLLWHEIQDACRKIRFFFKSVKTTALRPRVCMEDQYKLGYCNYSDVYTITMSGIVSEIWSFHSFHDNCIHVRTTCITLK